jgi:4a-hydroxytetrahydrobiopterin dehydratase
MEEERTLEPLSKEEIMSNLKKLTGWEYRDNKILKQFQFKNFQDSLDFINKLVPFCNKIDHHPDIHIYYSKVTFELTRYSIGGKVTERDFTVAEKIEELYKTWPK